jgi:hypothetical protein
MAAMLMLLLWPIPAGEIRPSPPDEFRSVTPGQSVDQPSKSDGSSTARFGRVSFKNLAQQHKRPSPIELAL